MNCTAKRTSKPAPIHPLVKKALGYDPTEPDADVYADWKERKTRVCKPCWELKYCPYGPLVEQSPTLPIERTRAEEHGQQIRAALARGYQGDVGTLSAERRAQLEEWVNDDELLVHQALQEIRDRTRLDEAEKFESDEEKLKAFLGGELPPIHIYRVEYDVSDDSPTEDDFSPDVWAEA